MTYSLTWLAQVLTDAGLKVAQQPDWATRGHGDVGEIKGVLCHHTAGGLQGNMPSLGVVTNGRPARPATLGHEAVPALSGPLANLCLGRDGAYYVVAAGRAYHAGCGSWQGVTTGNSSFIGIEAENTGVAGDPWPAVQMEAYQRGVAALLDKIGAKTIMCAGHKEYALPAGRKTDPDFDMDDFRAKVDAIRAGTASPALIPAAEADGKTRSTLRRGATGNDVKAIQAGVGVAADGVFGPATEAAVRAFQRTKQLVPDGIVGPATWAALDKG
jgi:N-acetyl-anhydromuramyl-L-alanine amidase AmpD